MISFPFLKDIKNDKTASLAYFLNGFFIITAAGLILFSYTKLPPFIPIFNQLPWGEQRLGPTISIFIPVLASSLIFIINIPVSALTYKKIPLVARMLAAVSLLAGALTCLFIVKTIILIL